MINPKGLYKTRGSIRVLHLLSANNQNLLGQEVCEIFSKQKQTWPQILVIESVFGAKFKHLSNFEKNNKVSKAGGTVTSQYIF